MLLTSFSFVIDLMLGYMYDRELFQIFFERDRDPTANLVPMASSFKNIKDELLSDTLPANEREVRQRLLPRPRVSFPFPTSGRHSWV